MALDLKKLTFFIEIPAGSSVKYEIDEENGMLMADRFLHTQMSYPTNYGFVVGTRGKDGDPVDVLVLSSQPVVPGVGMKGHVIGMLEMEDEEGVDTKILAVPDKKVDPLYGTWESIDDVPQHIKDLIKHFFDHYKELEPGKFVKTHDFKSRDVAEKELLESEEEGGMGKNCEDCDCENCDDCDCEDCMCDESCTCGGKNMCKNCDDCTCEGDEHKHEHHHEHKEEKK
ncbi:MAG TPA: inorganic diphosphatase [Candidatus Saccharimonadia bacterium]|nr:inorganic diphosphatase [Candidatus Saccharimonadia bacterium]